MLIPCAWWSLWPVSFSPSFERRDASVRNQFRGTKIRPRSTWPVATIPTQEELAILIAEGHPVLAAALAVVAETALRVGALPALSIREEGRYWTVSKGHQVVGPDPLSKEAKRMIHLARLDPQQPFSLASLRRVGWKWKDQAQTSAEGLVIARLQMKLSPCRARREGALRLLSVHGERSLWASASTVEPDGIPAIAERAIVDCKDVLRRYIGLDVVTR